MLERNKDTNRKAKRPGEKGKQYAERKARYEKEARHKKEEKTQEGWKDTERTARQKER
jgi:hypothetical protein